MKMLAHDLGRCGETPRQRFRELLLTPGTWAVVGYRLRRWLYRPAASRIVQIPLNIIAAFLQVAVEAITHVTLPVGVEIGPGLAIVHTGYVVVGSGVRIGRYCTLTQGVTIGHASGGRSNRQGCPTIGDRVYIGPGAILVGPIVVGDDALIGAGAVVTRSVPPRGVVAGNPARLLSRRGSFDLVTYPGMDADPARLAALAEARDESGAGSKSREGREVEA